MTAFPMAVVPLIAVWLAVKIGVGTILEKAPVLSSKPPLGIELLVVAFFSVFLWVVFRTSWLLCFASTDGDRLFLTSYRGTDEVPLDRIKKVEAFSRSRQPRIEVQFDPPTRLGKKIFIMPPIGFTRDAFWDVYEFLAPKAKDASHDARNQANPRSSQGQRIQIVVVVWVIIAVAALVLFYVSGSTKH